MLEYTFDRIYRFNERLLVYWDFGWERECMDGEIGEIGGGGSSWMVVALSRKRN